MSADPYQLFYWPTIQGRGEFIRLALEDTATPYVDVARQEGGMVAMQALIRGDGAHPAPFAPPFLRAGDLVIAQTANILAFLAPRIGLVPDGEAPRLHANQLQLTLADLVGEIHDTHHPIATSLYYEDQKPAARQRTAAFLTTRIPKFFNYFERTLERNAPRLQLLSQGFSYADLSLFQILTGLPYAFPRAMAHYAPKYPRLAELRAAVAARPGVAAYLASPRRIPFNQHDLFRAYPELDLLPGE